jgi:acyl-coenzyme A synthetase/AMP-(fatty) acid ligase
MLPMRWLQYETLPRNENGKIDRMALVNAFGAAEENRMERRSQ